MSVFFMRCFDYVKQRAFKYAALAFSYAVVAFSCAVGLMTKKP